MNIFYNCITNTHVENLHDFNIFHISSTQYFLSDLICNKPRVIEIDYLLQ